MERTVILAGSFREANAYCQDKGIRAVFAKSPAQVKRATTLIELPGFAKRRDRYTLEAARDSHLKFSRTEVEYITEDDWAPPVHKEDPGPTVYDLEERGESVSPRDLDLTNEAILEELKVALNEVGLTLKKLPAKKGDDSVAPKKQDAPVVDAPVEF